MWTRPLVSIIMPMYNCEQWVKRAIDSVMTQTFEDFELIIVNDNSTDASLDIALECAQKYKERDCIRVIDLDVNGGVSRARNIGMTKAFGRFITFLDSDDWIEPNYIAELVRPLDQKIYANIDHNKQIMPLVVTGYTNDSTTSMVSAKQVFQVAGFTTALDAIHAIGLFSSPWGKLYDKALIDKYNIKFDLAQRTGVEDVLFVMTYLIYLDFTYRKSYGSPVCVHYNRQSALHWCWNSEGLTSTKNAYHDLVRVFLSLFKLIHSVAKCSDYRNALESMLHVAFTQHVQNWGLKRLIRFNDTMDESLKTLKEIEQYSTKPVYEETIKLYSSLIRQESELPTVDAMTVYVMSETNIKLSDASVAKLKAYIQERFPDTELKLKFGRYLRGDVSIYTAADSSLSNLSGILSDMRQDKAKNALIYDMHDIIRHSYYSEIRRCIKDKSEVYVPANRIASHNSNGFLHIVESHGSRSLSPKAIDYRGAFIHIKRSYKPDKVLTDNAGYLLNGHDIYKADFIEDRETLNVK